METESLAFLEGRNTASASYFDMETGEITYSPRQPYRCPVCEGRGRVAYNFYGDKTPDPSGERTENCQSCLATGIIWG